MNSFSKIAVVLSAGLIGAAGAIGAASPAHAIEGGRKLSSDDAIARSTVAVNIHFTGVPGLPPPNPPDHSLNPCTGVIIDDDMVLTAAHCIKANSGFQLIFSTNAGDSQALVKDVTAYDVPLGDFNTATPSPARARTSPCFIFRVVCPADTSRPSFFWTKARSSRARS